MQLAQNAALAKKLRQYGVRSFRIQSSENIVQDNNWRTRVNRSCQCLEVLLAYSVTVAETASLPYYSMPLASA